MINTIKKINDGKFTMPVFKIQETIITTTFFFNVILFCSFPSAATLVGIQSHTNDTKNKRPRHSEWDAWCILTRGEGPWRGCGPGRMVSTGFLAEGHVQFHPAETQESVQKRSRTHTRGSGWGSEGPSTQRRVSRRGLGREGEGCGQQGLVSPQGSWGR